MRRPLRVLFDTSLAGNPAGTGTYVRGLYAALQARPEIEVVAASLGSTAVKTVDTRAKGAARRGLNSLHHLIYYLQTLPIQARRLDCQVIYCPSSLAPLRGSTPLLTTVFDLTPLRFAATQDWLSRQYVAGMLRIGVRRAAGVCTISRAVGTEIEARFPRVTSARIHVVYPGPNPGLLQATPVRPDLPDRPYVLMVGTVEPRKNHLTALRAFAEHRRQSPGSSLMLVVAGSAGWHYEPVMRAITDLGLSSHVVRLGGLPASALQWLYRNARGLLFPSLYEGFGLPVLEAMTLGCPVVAARIPSVIEIVGEDGTLLEPMDVAGWAAAIRRLDREAADGRRVAAAADRASRFSWQAAGAAAAAAIQAVAGPGR